MTKKVWFQVAVGILLALLIMKYFVEVQWIFNPLISIVNAIFIPLLLSSVLFYVTQPFQRFLEKRNVPRWGSILTILLTIAAIITALVMMIGDPVVKQFNALMKSAPSIADKIQEAVNFYLRNKDTMPSMVQDVIDYVANSVQDIAVVVSEWLVTFVSSVVSASLVAVLIPFFFIYMLKDHEEFAPAIYKFFTGQRQEWMKKTLSEMNGALASYVQGQVLISFILAVVMFVGYLIVGLDYALLLSIFAFFMNMIPFIGPWISLVPALIVAVIQDPMLVLWVSVITLVAQQLESNLITPNIMGKTLDIHPLTVITIILAAGNIGGFIGIVIAVPFYAVLKVIVSNLYEERNKIKKAATKSV